MIHVCDEFVLKFSAVVQVTELPVYNFHYCQRESENPW